MLSAPRDYLSSGSARERLYCTLLMRAKSPKQRPWFAPSFFWHCTFDFSWNMHFLRDVLCVCTCTVYFSTERLNEWFCYYSIDTNTLIKFLVAYVKLFFSLFFFFRSQVRLNLRHSETMAWYVMEKVNGVLNMCESRYMYMYMCMYNYTCWSLKWATCPSVCVCVWSQNEHSLKIEAQYFVKTHEMTNTFLILQGRVCWLPMETGGHGLAASSPRPSTSTYSDLTHSCLLTQPTY